MWVIHLASPGNVLLHGDVFAFILYDTFAPWKYRRYKAFRVSMDS